MSEKSPEEVLRDERLKVRSMCKGLLYDDPAPLSFDEQIVATQEAIDRLAEIAGIVGEMRGMECDHVRCEKRDRLLAKLRELDGKEG
jgi:hypothetical protein